MNVLQNLDRWIPRDALIREYQEEHYGADMGEATFALQNSGRLEEPTWDSFSPQVQEFARALHSCGDGCPEEPTDDVRPIVERLRPLLEQHKDEVFEMFVKCLLLEFNAATLIPVFAELRLAGRHVPSDDEAEAA